MKNLFILSVFALIANLSFCQNTQFCIYRATDMVDHDYVICVDFITCGVCEESEEAKCSKICNTIPITYGTDLVCFDWPCTSCPGTVCLSDCVTGITIVIDDIGYPVTSGSYVQIGEYKYYVTLTPTGLNTYCEHI